MTRATASTIFFIPILQPKAAFCLFPQIGNTRIPGRDPVLFPVSGDPDSFHQAMRRGIK
jgi:hypothetical protein